MDPLLIGAGAAVVAFDAYAYHKYMQGRDALAASHSSKARAMRIKRHFEADQEKPHAIPVHKPSQFAGYAAEGYSGASVMGSPETAGAREAVYYRPEAFAAAQEKALIAGAFEASRKQAEIVVPYKDAARLAVERAAFGAEHSGTGAPSDGVIGVTEMEVAFMRSELSLLRQRLELMGKTVAMAEEAKPARKANAPRAKAAVSVSASRVSAASKRPLIVNAIASKQVQARPAAQAPAAKPARSDLDSKQAHLQKLYMTRQIDVETYKVVSAEIAKARIGL